MNEQNLTQKNEVTNRFPIEVFPLQVREIILSVSRKNNFPQEYLAGAMLHASATAIGNTYWLKGQWDEAAIFFMALVGPPGANKSHPTDWAYSPLTKREQQLFEKRFKQASSNSGQSLNKILTADITIAALTELLQNNQRGICIYLDELSALLDNGSRNSQLLLSFFSRKPTIIDRKTSAPVQVKWPFVPIIGTMQTNIMEPVLNKGQRLENGFIERMLWIPLDDIQHMTRSLTTPDTKERKEWEGIINKLLKLDFDKDSTGNLKPNFLSCSNDTEKILLDYINAPIECTYNLPDEVIYRIKAKIDIYVFRFLIPLHVLKMICGKTKSLKIDADTARDAITLAKYFTKMAYHVWERLSKKNPLDFLTENKLAVYKELPEDFNTRAGMKVAAMFSMPERTFKYWLASDNKLFKRVGHGYYKKVYKD